MPCHRCTALAATHWLVGPAKNMKHNIIIVEKSDINKLYTRTHRLHLADCLRSDASSVNGDSIPSRFQQVHCSSVVHVFFFAVKELLIFLERYALIIVQP